MNILQKAKEGKYAVGQFNISTDEQLKAVAEVATELKSPIIIGASEGEREFIGDEQAVALVKSWQEENNLEVILNADHCKTFESAREAIDAGFTAVHFDGSELEIPENIKMTKRVVKYAKGVDKTIIVEGELGYMRGGSNIHEEKIKIMPEDLTKPEEAKEFFYKTGIDSLAVVIGNIHGIDVGIKNPNLDLKRLKDISKMLPDTCFVLHGGSGTPEGDIKEAVKLGVTKININTELRVAYSRAIKKFNKENPDVVKPYEMLKPGVEAMKEVVREKMKLFGSINKV